MPEPKMVHRKAKIDLLVSPEGLCEIIMYLNTHMHILQYVLQEDKIK